MWCAISWSWMNWTPPFSNLGLHLPVAIIMTLAWFSTKFLKAPILLGPWLKICTLVWNRGNWRSYTMLWIDIIKNKARYNRIDAKCRQMMFRSVPTNPYLESLVKWNWCKFRGLCRHSTSVVILPNSGGRVRNSPKLCWRNIWMVLFVNNTDVRSSATRCIFLVLHQHHPLHTNAICKVGSVMEFVANIN